MLSYTVLYKGTASLLSQCIMSILCLLTFWCRCVKCSTAYKWHGSWATIYTHHFCLHGIKSWPRCTVLRYRPRKEYRRNQRNLRGWKFILHMMIFTEYWSKSLTRMPLAVFLGRESPQIEVFLLFGRCQRMPHLTKSENHERKQL